VEKRGRELTGGLLHDSGHRRVQLVAKGVEGWRGGDTSWSGRRGTR
jgi:hypothetical protein